MERKELIWLIARFAVDHDLVLPCASIADHLIANGVTMQQWIPVEERLPDKEGQYLIWTTIYFIPDHVDECNHYDGMELAYYDPDFGFMGHVARNAKAWMPLPEQPKKEA